MTLVIQKLMSMAADFMNRAYDLGNSDKAEEIEFLKGQNSDLNIECIRRGQLLHYYRLKRANDGINSRPWNTRKHSLAERGIDHWEKNIKPLSEKDTDCGCWAVDNNRDCPDHLESGECRLKGGKEHVRG